MSRHSRRIVLGLSAVTTLALVTATPAVADKGWHGKPPTDLPKVPLMVGSGGAVSSVDRDASQVGIDVLRPGRQRRRRGGRHGSGARASPSPTAPASAAAGSSSTTTPRPRRSPRSTAARPRRQSFTADRFHRTRNGKPLTFHDGGQLRPVRRHPGHARAVGEGRSTARHVVARRAAEAGRAAGREGLRRRPDLPRPDRRQRRPVPQVPGHRGGLPARQRAAGRRVDLPQPRHGQGVPRAAHPRRRVAVRRPAGRGHRRRGRSTPRPRPASTSTRGSSRSSDLRAYRAPDQGPDHLAVQGFRRLRDAGAELRRHRRRARSSTSSRRTSRRPGQASPASTTPTTCTGSPRPRRRPSPTGTATSATCRACPSGELTSDGVRRRAGLHSSTPTTAQPRPIPFGNPDGIVRPLRAAGRAPGPAPRGPRRRPTSSRPTSGATSPSYTLTIEQTGGSGITVPGYGFLLNNELTDFNFTPLTAGRPGPEPARPGQAAALVDEPDHPRQGRPAVPRGRLAGRRDDHHLGQPDHPRLPRPRPVPRGRHRGAAALVPERHRGRRSRRSSTGARRRRTPGLGPRSAGTPPRSGAVTAIHPLGGSRVRGGGRDRTPRRWLGDGGPTGAVTRQPW